MTPEKTPIDIVKALNELDKMRRQWTKATALAYCAKADKTETYGLKYWSARDYLKQFDKKEKEETND